MLHCFHKIFVIFLSLICDECSVLCCSLWGTSDGTADKNRLNQTIRNSGSVIGFKQDIFEAVVERRLLTKLLPIIDNTDQSFPPFTRLAAEHHLKQTNRHQVLLLIETRETQGGAGEGEERVS